MYTHRRLGNYEGGVLLVILHDFNRKTNSLKIVNVVTTRKNNIIGPTTTSYFVLTRTNVI